MTLNKELESKLQSRVQQLLVLEEQGDVQGLYEMIDPGIRESREANLDAEPDLTLAGIRQYTSSIKSAILIQFSIEFFTEDGGESRRSLPTAFVKSLVQYNDRQPKEFRCPWVLWKEEWYTRATGKVSFRN